MYISALENCRKMKIRMYLHLTSKRNFFILLRLSDFVVYSTSHNIWSNGAYIIMFWRIM